MVKLRVTTYRTLRVSASLNSVPWVSPLVHRALGLLTAFSARDFKLYHLCKGKCGERNKMFGRENSSC